LIAVDTNVLVHAHREESEQHRAALSRLTQLAEGDIPWGLPVFCLAEFVRVVTHPRIFAPASPLERALEFVERVLAAPSVRMLHPGPRYPKLFVESVRAGDARGNLAFDAQIAAVCLEHGARELITLDRDFARFPQLSIAAL
jgi:toxin-antitoxin system PIN domain toxin